MGQDKLTNFTKTKQSSYFYLVNYKSIHFLYKFTIKNILKHDNKLNFRKKNLSLNFSL